jgi:chemosensory pili system protein ChpA (sensor histidine kinase/response regulator)
VAHGIEDPQTRLAAAKPVVGSINIHLYQQSNDVTVEFSDDGAGLNLERIHSHAQADGSMSVDAQLTDEQAIQLIFKPGFTTATEVTELSGRGIGLDVVLAEVNALGGRIETTTEPGQGTKFKLVLPLTTAVTQVVMLRIGEMSIGVPANLVEMVRRVPAADLERSYQDKVFDFNGESVPFFWAGALLQASAHNHEPKTKSSAVAVFRSAGQRLAMHVSEVLGNQEVVVKNLGPQLSRLPGLVGMSVLASGAVVLIYNPVALTSVYGQAARQFSAQAEQDRRSSPALPDSISQTPMVLVVDDSITVRRVTQRLLKREGFRVVLAADGLQALEKLREEKPAVILSDIEMPRMDGFDLARNIRADAKLHDIPIIMITSRIAEKHRDHARELGVDHYLGKPYSEDELIGLVRQYCAALAEATP